MTADDGITIEISGNDVLQQWLGALPAALTGALMAQSDMLAQQLVQTIVDEKLSGEVLQSRTGKLRSSMESSVAVTDSGVGGQITSDGVAYAAIQEYGGVTKAHIIEATKAKALAFEMQGKQAFFKRIQHPGSVIPERSFMRSALEESIDTIVSGFRQALADVTAD